MRPSRRFLWLLLLAVVAALASVFSGQLGLPMPELALMPLGILLVAFVADWIMSPKLRKLQILLDHQREVFAGDQTTIAFKAVGEHLPKTLNGLIAQSEGFSFHSKNNHLPSFTFKGDEAHLTQRAKRRGVWAFDTIWLNWKSRWGLIDFSPTRKIDLTIRVVPNIKSITSGQIDLDISSSIYGAKQTAWRGEGSEFHQMNEYVQGMDPRSIDWKRSARAHSLLAKEMRAERNHQVILAMDNGHLMREDVDGLPKIDHKINAALALAWAGVQGGDQVGLFAFDARPRLYSPPRAGRAAFSHIRSEMAELAYKSIETNHSLALSHLQSRLGKRSLVVVFSDFADPLTAQLMLEHLAIMSRHHVVIFVSLRDPMLKRLIGQKSSDMRDIARSVSAAKLLDERRLVLEKLSKMGVHVLETDPGDMTPRLINTYLAIKSKEAI